MTALEIMVTCIELNFSNNSHCIILLFNDSITIEVLIGYTNI